MALVDSMLNLFSKQTKDPDAPKPPVGSRSEREAKIKDKAGMVINIFALLLAINTYIGGTLSSTVMNNTIKANDIYNFYQAKSIKQTLAEMGAEDAAVRGDKTAETKYLEKAARYESDPATGEGKKELLAKAKKLEDERDHAKKRSPWISYASTAFQLSIVLLSASILAVNMMMFWASFGTAGIGLLLMSQGVWLWF
jgi:Domain of unknown function (DUF4337)